MIRIIAKRYAKALLELSAEKKLVEKTKADLAAFVEAIDSSTDLQQLLESPVFTPENKKAVIQELAGKLKAQQTSKRFFEYLVEAGRIRYVKEVQEAFLALLAEQQNRATARLTTAVRVKPAELAEIKKKLEDLTGKQVDIDAQVDASLIGGAKAQIGSVVYDGTVKNHIDKMRVKLMN